jgi:hypothetical protein
MTDRQQSQQSRKNNGLQGTAPPTTEDELLRSEAAAEPVNAPLMQRAQTDPTTLTARQVLQLQRTIGNRAVNNLLATNRPVQRKPIQPAPVTIQRDENEDEPLTADHENDSALETAIARQIDTAPTTAVQRGLFSKGKGNVAQGPLSEIKQTGLAGVTGMGVYRAITRGLDLIKGAKEVGGELFKGALTEFANLLNGMAIPGFVSLIKRIYDAITTYIGMSGLKTAFEGLQTKEKTAPLSPDEANLKEASGHGFGKVRRRFYKAVYLVVSSIIKVAAHIITLVSGGTTAMVSEMVALGASVLEGIQTLYEKGKGFIKWLRNKRGAHRKQSADRIIASALSKDATALKILIDLNAYSTIRNEKFALKHGHGGVDTPETPDEMYNLLVTFKDDPGKYGTLVEYHDDVMKKLKSG